MGLVYEYTCSGCGYRATVFDGPGFVVVNELRSCRGCAELVGVAVRGDADDVSLGVCPRCGSSDLVAPRSRSPACPRCGAPTRRRSAGLWD